MTRISRLVWVASALILAAIRPAAAANATVNFALDWIVSGRHAPWFLALEKGFYKDEGLDVKISRGYGFQDGMQRLMSGQSQFNFNDITSLVIARGTQAVPAKAVAIIYSKNPVAVFSLKKSGIVKPSDLKGKSIATEPGGVSRVLFPGFARVNNLDPNSVNWVSSRGAQKVPLLISGKVDAITNYIMEKPNLEKQAASQGGINDFMYADWGLPLLSNAILVTDDYAHKDPTVVRAFVKASLRGFAYSFDHPDEAVNALLKHEPLLERNIARQELEMVKQLVLTDEARKQGLGYMDPAKVQSTISTVAKYYELKRVPKPAEIYTNEFLK